MLIIVGSRRDGNSLKLANKVKEALEKDRIFTEIIVPGNQKIHICTGCRDCDKDGKCDFVDDMAKDIDKIKKEEYIMMITPTRWNLISGDLKIFIDRLNPMYAREELKGKKLIAVSIGAKKKDLYSSEASLSDLVSFAESAKMQVILEKQFCDCLKEDAIYEHSIEIDSFIEEVKKCIS